MHNNYLRKNGQPIIGSAKKRQPSLLFENLSNSINNNSLVQEAESLRQIRVYKNRIENCKQELSNWQNKYNLLKQSHQTTKEQNIILKRDNVKLNQELKEIFRGQKVERGISTILNKIQSSGKDLQKSVALKRDCTNLNQQISIVKNSLKTSREKMEKLEATILNQQKLIKCLQENFFRVSETTSEDFELIPYSIRIPSKTVEQS